MLDLRENIPLAPLTSLRIGGPARFFCAPDSREELLEAFRFARDRELPFLVLGRGSNVLVADEGIPGVVAHLGRSFDELRFDEKRGVVVATAGCPMPKLAVRAGRLGWTAFNFLVGIPGSVGGGVMMNAGLGGPDGRSIRDVLVEATLLDSRTGVVRTMPASELGLRYRGSHLARDRLWLLEATFALGERSSTGAAKVARQEIIQRRADKQPLQSATCGSTFKQPEGGRPAGWYIDRAGLKGTSVGGAAISSVHANWVENRDGATAADVKALMDVARERVRNEFGVSLEREVRFLPEDHLGGSTDRDG